MRRGVTLYREIIPTNIISTVRNHYLYVTRFIEDKVDTGTNLFSDQIYPNIIYTVKNFLFAYHHIMSNPQ
jgi:hypothetical protein